MHELTALVLHKPPLIMTEASLNVAFLISVAIAATELQARRPHFIALRFSALQIPCLLQTEGWWQPCMEPVYQRPVFQQHLLTSCL